MSHDHSHAHETEGLMSPYLARKRYSAASKYIGNKDIVLDLGCGMGGFSEHLPSEVVYFGVDSQKNWEGESDNLFQANFSDPLPNKLKSKNISVVTALAFIEHLSDPAELFDAVSAVLTKNGKFVLTTPHPIGRKIHDFASKLKLASSHASDEHEDFLDESDMKKYAKQCGYELASYKRFLFGMNQIAVFRKK